MAADHVMCLIFCSAAVCVSSFSFLPSFLQCLMEWLGKMSLLGKLNVYNGIYLDLFLSLCYFIFLSLFVEDRLSGGGGPAFVE